MIKVWQYLSKHDNEWKTILKRPNEYELKDYEKYFYSLRQIKVEESNDYIGYE